MKTSHATYWSRRLAGLVGLMAIVGFPPLMRGAPGQQVSTAAPPDAAATNADFQVDVLSLTVSKLGRDGFGNAVSPFNVLGVSTEQSGTVVLAKITPHFSTPLELLREKCRLTGFKDDAGTDLFPNANAGLGNDLFSANRPLEMLNANEPACFGVKIKSARLPARAATRLTAEVLLAFAPAGGERSQSKSEVGLQAGQITTVGPVKIKIIGPHNSSHRTNETAYWWASFLPDPDVIVTSVAFLSEKSDEPVLVVKNIEAKVPGRSRGADKSGPGKAEAKDDFSSLSGYSFIPPANGKVTIKIRYFDAKELVTKRCFISTGISP